MSTSGAFVQDMPPPGGYSKINYKRVPAKVVMNAAKLFGAFFVLQFSALYYKLYHIRPAQRKEKLEDRSALLAAAPFLCAERDRAVLLQMRRNRIAEEELMKDVPGWEVGTLYGEPIYKTLGKSEWLMPRFFEFYAHSRDDVFNQHINCHFRR